MLDVYKTIRNPSTETLFKDKNSKFFGYAFPVNNEEDIKSNLLKIKKLHPNAGHHCYAYQIGVEELKYRANDDGEPNNSAGLPIYGQIQSFGVTNILLITVRYFGGTKLGVSGLISAYRTSAKLSLEASEIIEKVIKVQYELKFNYDTMSKVMRIIKEKNIEIIHQKLDLDCTYKIAVRKKEANVIFEVFKNIFQLSIKKLEPHSF